MRDVRVKYTVTQSVAWTEKQAEEIKKLAERLNTSFSEVVRVCVERELPRMKERARKRKN